MAVWLILILSRKHLSNGQPTNTTPTPTQAPAMNGAQAWRNGLVNPTDITNSEARRWSGSTTMSNDIGNHEFSTSTHVPHSICKFRRPDILDETNDQTKP